METVVRQNAARIVGRVVREFDSRWPRKVRPSVAMVRRAIIGRRVLALRRRAKFIIFELDAGGFLLVHLRMSGRFEWLSSGVDEPGHVRATWTFDDGSRLAFCDARKFGVIEHAAALDRLEAVLGVEPLSPDFSAATLSRLLSGRRRRLKPLLLDQSIVAGLGNIYVDESLHRAGLHPLMSADALTPRQTAALARAIRAVLREAIERNGTSLDWIYPGGRMQQRLRVYGRAGAPCVRCGTRIESMRVGQRGTHICPTCQPMV